MEKEEIKSIILSIAEEDINTIEKRIIDIKNTIEDLEKLRVKNFGLNIDDRYKILRYKYFLEKNQLFKQEIIDFKDEFSTEHNFTYEESNITKILSKLTPNMEMPSNFYNDYLKYRNDISYHRLRPESLHELTYAFEQIPCCYDLYDDIKYAYYNDTEKYIEICDAYIKTYVLNKLESIHESNIFLHQRKKSILAIIDLYKSKNFIPLAYMLPAFIEGIIHEICEKTGLKSSKNDKLSINESIKYIKEKIGDIYGLDYFLFVFPIKRNKAAHGIIKDHECIEIAHKFLVDISLLISISENDNIPLNKFISIIENPKIPTIFDLFSYDEYKLNDEMNAKFKKLGAFFNQTNFWDNLYHWTLEKKSIDKTFFFLKKLIGNSYKLDNQREIKEKSIEFLKLKIPEMKKKIFENEIKTDEILKIFKEKMTNKPPAQNSKSSTPV